MSRPRATMKATTVSMVVTPSESQLPDRGFRLAAGGRIQRQQVLQGLRLGGNEPSQSCKVYRVDLVEADAALQERRHRHLVGRVEHRGGSGRRGQRVPGELQARKALAVAAAVQGFEAHVRQCAEVQ